MSEIKNKKIAFFGLGNMGAPMAANLIQAGFELHVYDPVAANLKEAASLGAKTYTDPISCGRGQSLVFSMLPSGAIVSELLEQLFPVVQTGTLFVDSSTISPMDAKALAKRIEQGGHRFLDAPVSGGTAGAKAGSLTFMVGGEKADLEQARPVLEKMGKNIFFAGPVGSGQVAKVCNNMLLAIHMIGTAEALNLGRALGSDPKVLSEIMLKSSGRNWSLEVYNPIPGVQENVPSSRDFAGGFMVDLMSKDLSLARDAAIATKTASPLGAQAAELYRLLQKAGLGKKDFSVVSRFLEPG
jgi:3-hydroxyisobutyrate dehydrogenase